VVQSPSPKNRVNLSAGRILATLFTQPIGNEAHVNTRFLYPLAKELHAVAAVIARRM